MECLSDDIFWETTKFLEFHSLVALAGATRTIRRRIHSRFMSNYDANLRHYVDCPEGLRSLMRATGAVISGSCSQEFLHRVRHSDSAGDLEIYTPFEFHQSFLNYLMVVEGYSTEFISYADVGNEELNPGVYAVATLVIPDFTNDWQARVRVIASIDSCPFIPILCSHSTTLMNWIGPDSLTVLYPVLTFAKRGLINQRYSFMIDSGVTHSRSHCHYDATQERNRGYDLRLDPSTWHKAHTCTKFSACPHTARFVGDVATMHVHFNARTPTEHDVGCRGQDQVMWRLGGIACKGYSFVTKKCIAWGVGP